MTFTYRSKRFTSAIQIGSGNQDSARWLGAIMSDGLRVRRNIDGLTNDLADYIYAFQKLKEPGRPYYDSYDYFQALHDRMGKKPGEGMCEHGNETFLPWHRAHLFAF